MVWDYVAIAAWQATTAYVEDDLVTNDTGKTYRCVTAGTSAGSGGPTGTGAAITDGTVVWDYVATPAWAAATAKALGAFVTNDSGKHYVAVTAGITAAGPSGTGTAIEDGTAEWNYVSVATNPPTVREGENARGFRVGTTGNVKVVMESGEVVIWYSVPVSTTPILCAFSSIVSSGTTAEKITVLFG